MRSHALAAATVALALVQAGPSSAQSLGCAPPVPPFVPNDPRDVQVYSDLIRSDFETYIADFEGYMRCLDVERARAFEEGHAVIQEYGRFQQLTEQKGSRDPAS